MRMVWAWLKRLLNFEFLNILLHLSPSSAGKSTCRDLNKVRKRRYEGICSAVSYADYSTLVNRKFFQPLDLREIQRRLGDAFPMGEEINKSFAFHSQMV
jgi:hypothetical protein